MGEDVQNEYAFGLVIDPGDQPIMVAVNIEHSSSAYDVRMSEVIPHLSQRAPIRSPSDPVPVHQRDQRIWVPFGEFQNGWLADNAHQ
jgi:hypothetical protein